ncbi:hypothetical protein Fmac_024509 [Flemingia macrophylla]|uniref:Uncharacterized protein n=1 Tax=Flemingia macrophylla TaxID=520843 RepID=A0ABD1LPL6_9FABA
MKERAFGSGAGGHCEGKNSKDGCVSASKGMGSQTSKNVGSKRVKQTTSVPGDSYKAINGDKMKMSMVEKMIFIFQELMQGDLPDF